MRMEAVFWGKVHWRLGPEGWPSPLFIVITNTWRVEVFCQRQMLFFRQKCDEESVGQTGGQTGGQTLLHVVVKLPCYLCSCNAVISLSDRHALDLHCRLICSHWFSLPIIQPWYYLQRRISAGAKFHPSPHLKLSHRGGYEEPVQDPLMQHQTQINLHVPLDLLLEAAPCSVSPWFSLTL